MLLEIQTVPILDCGVMSHEKFLSIDLNPLRSRKCLWCLHEWESYPRRPASCPSCREPEWDKPLLVVRTRGIGTMSQAEKRCALPARRRNDGTDAR